MADLSDIKDDELEMLRFCVEVQVTNAQLRVKQCRIHHRGLSRARRDRNILVELQNKIGAARGGSGNSIRTGP